MSFEIKKATRQGFVPLIAFYSESGCGKTYSSLLVARGLAGPEGKIVMIDSEGGRGELYADVDIIGGYDVIRIDEPFTPARYIEAISYAQKEGADVIISDSGSHEWEGSGGVLDMAADKEAKSGRAGLHNWKLPKFEHAKFIQALTRIKIPVVICLRAKYKTRQMKDKGKTVIVKDDHTSPIQAEDFIFEATCHGEIMPNHDLRLTKWSHPKLKECFPVKGPVTIQTGELIKKWCQSASDTQPESKTKSVKELKAKLWNLTKEYHKEDVGEFEKWMKDNNLIEKEESVTTLDADRLETVIDMTEIKLAELRGVS